MKVQTGAYYDSFIHVHYGYNHETMRQFLNYEISLFDKITLRIKVLFHISEIDDIFGFYKLE